MVLLERKPGCVSSYEQVQPGRQPMEEPERMENGETSSFNWLRNGFRTLDPHDDTTG